MPRRGEELETCRPTDLQRVVSISAVPLHVMLAQGMLTLKDASRAIECSKICRMRCAMPGPRRWVAQVRLGRGFLKPKLRHAETFANSPRVELLCRWRWATCSLKVGSLPCKELSPSAFFEGLSLLPPSMPPRGAAAPISVSSASQALCNLDVHTMCLEENLRSSSHSTSSKFSPASSGTSTGVGLCKIYRLFFSGLSPTLST